MIDSKSAQKIGRFLHAQFVVGGTMTDMTGDVAYQQKFTFPDIDLSR